MANAMWPRHGKLTKKKKNYLLLIGTLENELYELL